MTPRSLLASLTTTWRLVYVLVPSCMLPAMSPAHAKLPSTQYVNIAPLPGAGVALDSRGKPDGFGAIQLNIPIAYTPGANQSCISLFSGNHIREFETTPSNGTGIFGAGFGGFPRLYITAMQVSSLIFRESKALSFQMQLTEENGQWPAIALGAQDLLNKEKTTGEAKSFYFVATKSLKSTNKPLYLTFGYGSGRFLHHPFGGISTPLSNNLNLILEYDGFQINEGLAWRPGGRFGPLTFTAGYNNRCGVILGTSLSVNLSTQTQLLIGTTLAAIRKN